MKKKLQKYLSGEREGFSLIELIIVIAIMAILIGVIALAVIPYLEKSRVGKDQQTVDTVYGAFQATIADQKISTDITVTIPASGDATVTAVSGLTDADKEAFLNSMAEALNAKDKTDIGKGTAGKLESKEAVDSTKGNKTIVCTFDADTGTITVQVKNVNSIKSSNKK